MATTATPDPLETVWADVQSVLRDPEPAPQTVDAYQRAVREARAELRTAHPGPVHGAQVIDLGAYRRSRTR